MKDLSSIDTFLRQHQDIEIGIGEFKGIITNHRNIHNHTIENLYLYFSLQQHLDKGRVRFYPGCVFIIDNRRYKWFIYDFDTFNEFFDLEIFSLEIKNKMIFYSSTELINTNLVKSKIKECIYDLIKMFSEDYYFNYYQGKDHKEIKKKIYNKIIYPFKWIVREQDRFRVCELSEEHITLIEDLHKEWCNYKLSQEKTFKMMFSTNRYNKCVREALSPISLKDSRWFKKGFFYDNKLIAVRLCLLVGDRSFDISFFSKFWDMPSNLNNYINTWCMKEMYTNYKILFHNTGAELDKYLQAFKYHFPHENLITYKYNFKK